MLRKFGMIPRDYDLHAEFIKLLREQVAAFYDQDENSEPAGLDSPPNYNGQYWHMS